MHYVYVYLWYFKLLYLSYGFEGALITYSTWDISYNKCLS